MRRVLSADGLLESEPISCVLHFAELHDRLGLDPANRVSQTFEGVCQFEDGADRVVYRPPGIGEGELLSAVTRVVLGLWKRLSRDRR